MALDGSFDEGSFIWLRRMGRGGLAARTLPWWPAALVNMGDGRGDALGVLALDLPDDGEQVHEQR